MISDQLLPVGLVENMAEFQQQEVLNSSGEQGLLLWLLKRIRVRTFDANKLYSTEILSILLQNNTGNQQLLGAKNGIDCLLEAVSLYKRREPVTGDEVEMVENLFDCLCMSLTHAPNRVKFLEGEGLQLMILLLKDRYVVLLFIISVCSMRNLQGMFIDYLLSLPWLKSYKS